ncbi:MAG: helix-turn-helix domain-containing protein [Deferrisomatales bacterium]
MSETAETQEQVLVVSRSPCLARRIRAALTPSRFAVEQVGDPAQLGGLRRQRPFLLCFVDARGPAAAEEVERCVGARPAERYVLVLAGGQAAPRGEDPARGEPFGFVREPFGAAEVRAWVQRAGDEARLLRGDRPLEDLLYGRFRLFLRDLGPQATTALHSLVLERVERPLITSVLEWTGGNQTRAAEILGIHRNTLRAKIRTLGVAVGPGNGGD